MFNNYDLVYTSDDNRNWLYEKYYASGHNSRYVTFQAALNLLFQTVEAPLIVETGCQRQEEDLGAGMSTSIFGEYVHKFGGKLITVDLLERHLDICRECTSDFSESIKYVLSDSIDYLGNMEGEGCIDLLYLDSLDYPVGDQEGDEQLQKAAQIHCFNEFRVAERHLVKGSILLIDDNQLPGGGKPKILKDHLSGKPGWVCLYDLQQSLWLKME